MISHDILIHSMKAKLKPNVLAIYNLRDKAGRDILAGMLESMSDKEEWHLYVLQPGDDFDVRNYNGYIVTMPGSSKAMKALARSKVPTVLVNIANREMAARTENVSFVWTDNADIGRRSAEHLLERSGYKSAGYVHELKYEFYSYEREVAFRARMEKAGYASVQFPPDKDFSDYHRRLCAWLRDLPKPAAVMAVSDMRAVDVVNACREEGIAVPELVSIVGVDNDRAQHEKCGTGISSVLPDFRSMGRTAARELEFLFRHPKRKGRPHEILIPVKEVIARESTARSLPAAKLVRNALDFIEANRLRNLTRADVVAHLGCSLQLAELRFRQIAGKTIRAAIEDARMNEVNRRLRQENFSVRETAKALGFTSANHLSRIYRRHFGRTISEALGKTA